MRYVKVLTVLACVGIMAGCASTGKDAKMTENTFGDDLEFLRKHTEVVLLSDSSGDGQVAVLPRMQGRVMTSTAEGADGLSFGWINRELVASGEFVEHINVFGGEDRFWIGPEGGQFSIFFKNGVPFDLEHWYTPAPIDTEAFELVSASRNRAVLKKDMRLENYSRTVFDLRVDREVRILGKEEAVNETNTGEAAWKKETGLLSIWILGMFNPSPKTTVVVPFNAGPESTLGPAVNDSYFGKVPSDRLVVEDDVLFFSGDGQYRSKIGLSPQRSKPVLGSYDATNKVLTIVQYNKPTGVTDYVNSMWELQDEPFKGDVVNSYNDGPAEPGAEPMGPFYELESSCMAAALDPGEKISHIHRTFHLQGSEEDLDPIAKATLGVTIEKIKSAL
ncbi:MAG: DUF6786 family protein [Planctomycetota bacterium]|jgi:hypothetical protein